GIFALHRLYDRHFVFTCFQEYTRVINACMAGMLTLVLMSFLDPTLLISRGWLLLTCFLSIVFVGSCRFSARRLLRQLRRRGLFVTPTVIIGANEEGKALAEQFLADLGSGMRLIGFADDTVTVGTPVFGGLQVISNLADLDAAVHQRGVQEILIAMTSLSRDQLLDVYRTFGHDEDVELRLSSGLFEILTTGVRVHEVSCVPLMTPQRVRITEIDSFLKMLLDYVGAVVALIIFSPLIFFIGFLVKLDSPGPILYRRRVLGRCGKPFDALKFRTMVVNADEVLANDPELREAFEKGYKLKSDPRVTRVGRLLRRSSLDELPQLINVLRGEMSLVGPRMITPEEATRYGKWQLNLLTVKPGITGPWQINGRSEIPYEDRVRLSMHYIRNYSIWLDLGILIRTILVVVQGKGAY
ncbi:MAG TPA: sugar transferase, partial [Chloroflexota bacterium]|nr:sugar transferase [Chloroflexota bacterium]